MSQIKKQIKVAVGLSGGVDSAVSAMLLKKAGYDVTGVHLYCWPPKSEIEKDNITRAEWFVKNGCRADEDRKSALKTALEVGIPFKTLDFSEQYKKRVVDYFYAQYQAGRTPNPDVLCNSEIKFGLFLDWALENGFDYVATGHYAKKKSNFKFKILNQIKNQKSKLQIPKDKHKDQTYFLWKLTQKELQHVLFPLGDYLKSEVREIAKKEGLSVAGRKDSQGICFVGDVNVQKFLRLRLKEKYGEVVNVKGDVIGKHKGVWFYTIGQRHGFEVGKHIGDKHTHPALYVVDKDAENNRLVVGFGAETYRDSFRVANLNLINTSPLSPPTLGGEIYVRIRHGGELIKAKVISKKEKVRVELEEPQRGVASGQSAVFYDAEGQVVGGGVIL